jgi:hypothetical protein
MLWVLLCSFLVRFLVYSLIHFWLTMVKWTVLWCLGARRGWSPSLPFMISLYLKWETWCLTTRIVILSSLVHQSTNLKLVLGSQVPFRIRLCPSDWPFPSPSRASLTLLMRKFQIFHVAIFLCDSSTYLFWRQFQGIQVWLDRSNSHILSAILSLSHGMFLSMVCFCLALP